MSNRYRRFEVMLPLEFNDGKPVPREWLGRAVREVALHFKGASFEPQIIKGLWVHEGTLYRDNLSRLTVDVTDAQKNRRWMKEFKTQWKAKLDQLELWLVSWRIEIE